MRLAKEPREICKVSPSSTLDMWCGATLPAGTVLPESLTTLEMRCGATLPAGTALPGSLTTLEIRYGATLPAGCATAAQIKRFGLVEVD